ncbi:hypothetical protein KP509_34G040100 [Ceratopteris richardii]|uniref:Glycoside hydrolase family 19 catalytic domain-containing protein n=1 Tax=Ceratopteris richardii TaxID=49495 RepID=A0A8T2QLJ0_CERRI|nr:hypothetical protein KP509_34G040100 [Ceratopteris richardii]KAH7284122.1 hypothetical protein KP509_34G040100 [Ceratopteris richardii]KAH7284123.1 hypothetical protein KP509_34G040100 [Ceratopteris richardii]
MRTTGCTIFFLVALCLVSTASAFNAFCKEGKKCETNKTIAQIFSEQDFDTLFPQRNLPIAHAAGFWNHYEFIQAAAMFEPLGFATTGDEIMQRTELAAFLAHVAHETTCGWSVAPKGPFAWGLCYKEELSPDSLYCEPSDVYPCVPGISYHGRGAMPVYWNYNYGKLGKYLKKDLLHRPDWLASNATLAFQAAIATWMLPVRPKQPSCHDVMTGKWVPSKNDTANSIYPGFGMTINILNGFVECGHGDDIRMIDRISHYLLFLDLLGVGRDNAGPYTGCGLQKMLYTPFDKS